MIDTARLASPKEEIFESLHLRSPWGLHSDGIPLNQHFVMQYISTILKEIWQAIELRIQPSSKTVF